MPSIFKMPPDEMADRTRRIGSRPAHLKFPGASSETRRSHLLRLRYHVETSLATKAVCGSGTLLYLCVSFDMPLEYCAWYLAKSVHVFEPFLRR